MIPPIKELTIARVDFPDPIVKICSTENSICGMMKKLYANRYSRHSSETDGWVPKTPVNVRVNSKNTVLNPKPTIAARIANCGSYIAVGKIRDNTFDTYDGVFSVVDTKSKRLYTRPAGRYLRGFCIGDWDKIQDVYAKVLDFADTQHLQLSGYSFESGLNEFAIADEGEYITQIEICAN